ncbi:hypothetical protein [Mesorhizobium sp. KR9-304]|uniref:hypothetical protein n=1 Tax=Mesorhizobium sp. KR9-304 TaxID=3156614 RepID=UPI0032B38E4D
MANLIIQDTFDPYYAGRDNDDARAKPRQVAMKKSEHSAESEIRLSKQAPAAEVRRDRRPTAH